MQAINRAMLFGMERGRGIAAAKDDFSKYQPWENPNYYAGVMRFRCGNRNFRLERSFDRISKQVSLVCEDDGEELSVEHGDLDILLGGITPGMYDNTVSIGQFQSRPGQELAESLKNPRNASCGDFFYTVCSGRADGSSGRSSSVSASVISSVRAACRRLVCRRAVLRSRSPTRMMLSLPVQRRLWASS